ncbi:MAG: AI-2E family transporter [Muribaculaceae bacterium]|nr:AI-2E family transporter [Muribaculaceae bacterium]
MSHKPYTFDRVVRLVITLLLALGIIWLLYRLRDALIPFFVACLIAYMIEPFVRFNRNLLKLRGRVLPILITLFEITLLFSVLCFLCIPSIMEEFHQIAELIRTYASNEVDIPFLPEIFHSVLKKNIDLEQVAGWLFDQNVENLMDHGMRFISGGLDVVLTIVSWFIVFLYVAFILLDYEKLMRGFRDLVPPKYRSSVSRVAHDVKTSMNLYFRGQATIALFVAAIYSIGFLIIGLPLAVVMGIIIGVLFMVPYLQYLSLIPVTALCLVMSADGSADFWTVWWECIAVYAVVQIVADVILTPKIMGKAMGLNPAIILLSLSVWGSLLGFLGLIIALPLTTLLLSYYDIYIIHPQAEKLGREGERGEKLIEDVLEDTLDD